MRSKKNKQAAGKSLRAKLIANPGSGKTANKPILLEQVVRSLMAQGIEVEVAFARPKKMAVPVAHKAVKDGYKLVIAMGGDDTIEAVMRGLAGSKTRLGIIPAGTENNVALSLGIPEDPLKACELITTGQTLKLDMGQVKVGHKKFAFFEVATIGLAAAIYPHIKEIPKGNLASIKDAAVTILNHEARPSVSLELDHDSRVTVETMLVTVTNIPYIGLKFLVAPDASMQDGLLDISVYPGFSKAELFTYFGKVMNGGRTADGKIQRFRAGRLKIKTSPELEVMADGVMLGCGKVQIKVKRAALRVIVPQAFVKVSSPAKADEVELPAPVAPVAAS